MSYKNVFCNGSAASRKPFEPIDHITFVRTSPSKMIFQAEKCPGPQWLLVISPCFLFVNVQLPATPSFPDGWISSRSQVVLSGGRIVGATVVSQGAGEIASELGLAISKKMKRLGPWVRFWCLGWGGKCQKNHEKQMLVLMGFLQGDLVWGTNQVDMRLGLS